MHRRLPRSRPDRLPRPSYGLGLVVLAVSIAMAAAAWADPPPEVLAKLSGEVRERLESLPTTGRVSIIVMLDEAALPGVGNGRARRAAIHSRQREVLAGLPRGGWSLGRRYENLASFSGRATAGVIEAIARHSKVIRIDIDGTFHASLSQGVPLTGANIANSMGFSGSGVAVAVLDSGIDTDHADLVDDLVAEVCYCEGAPPPNRGCCPNGRDSQFGAGAAEDDEGHGTSVAGIITAGGVQASAGVAPDAGIVAMKVLDNTGSGSFSDTAAALDWLITNHGTYGVRVVNLSLGDGIERSNPLSATCNSSATALAIRDLHALGVVTFVASGNEGHDDGIAFPACTAEAISVGGVYDANVGGISWCGATCSTILCTDSTTFADKFVCHSNSDEILDVLAPDWRTYTSQLGGGAVNFGGTSAASPYASALAALLIEQDPGRSPEDIRSLMKNNGPMVTNSDNGLSFRRTDVTSLFVPPSVCGNSVAEAGEQCDDGNTAAGDCCSASCQWELPGSTCDDGDACTEPDTCDGAGTCSPPFEVDCDDGTYCNGEESCDSIIGCVAGTPPALSDGVACTVDFCDDAIDTVIHTPDDAVCDNGAFCDGAESCDALLDCQVGSPPASDDGIACTVDACDEGSDSVTHTPDDAVCDNGAFCDGAEYCDPALDCQAGMPPTVDDGVLCTIDACDEPGEAVTHLPSVALCDDGDECTAESCDAITGCASDPIPGCGVAVPATGPFARLMVGLVLMAAGALWLMLSRRQPQSIG